MVNTQSVPIRILQLASGFILAIVLGLLLVRGSEAILVTPVYKVARDPTWPGLRDHVSDAAITMLGDELLQRIGELEGFEVRNVSVPTGRLWEGLQNGTWDAILTSVVPNEELQSRYGFSNPYYLTGPVLIVRTDTTYQRLADLDNKRVGISRYAQSYYLFIRDLSILINPFDDVSKAVQALLDGSIDAVMVPMEEARMFTAGTFKERLRIAGSHLSADGLRLVVVKGENDDFIVSFNDGLKTHIATGDLAGLLQKWGLPKTAMPQTPIPREVP